MKILFNCTTNVVGGGVKNSAIFIKYALEHDETDWLFAISKPVQEILDKWNIVDTRICRFDTSPARNKKQRKKLLQVAEAYSPDIIYTMAGPAYVGFRHLHVMGVSNPYLTHANWRAFIVHKKMTYLLHLVSTVVYQAFHVCRAHHWVFQTEMARNGFIKRFFVKRHKTHVIPNSIDDEFVAYYRNKPPHLVTIAKTVTIFCPGAAYWHKAFHLIPKIAYALRKLSVGQYDFNFVFTLPSNSALWKKICKRAEKLKVARHIKNIGPYNYTKAISLFDHADIVFVPSLLETFSASYLEAFASKRPLVAADKDFARQVCKDAAVYVDPFDHRSTASLLNNLILDHSEQQNLIENGVKIIEKYGLQKERVNRIILLLIEVKRTHEKPD